MFMYHPADVVLTQREAVSIINGFQQLSLKQFTIWKRKVAFIIQTAETFQLLKIVPFWKKKICMIYLFLQIPAGE